MDKIFTGRKGEELAVKFLKESGYVLLKRNYRTTMGEVDIIAEEGGALVFIEVKARFSLRYGDPKEAVTEQKKRQISKAALHFMSKNNLLGRRARFDVVAIRFTGDKPQFELIKNAFDVSY